ncbi:MAG: hypothetical protein ACO37F_08120 [Pirellulales bacterium]
MSQMPNNNAEDQGRPNGGAAGNSGAGQSPAENSGDELVVQGNELSQKEATALIRDAAGQLKDFLADRRRESEELARRMTRMEEEIQRSGSSGRYVVTLSVVVALIAFVATTGLWRLTRNQAEVEAALRQTMQEVTLSREASLQEIGAVQGAVAESVAKQAEAALRLEKQLADVESVGNRSVAGISGLQKELTGRLADQQDAAKRLEERLGQTSQQVAKVRDDVSERLKRQSELTKEERARMIGEIKAAITGFEASLEQRSQDLAKQSETLKSQQQQFSEATASAKAERQAMIRAATQTVNAQLLSLQTMLDALERGQPGNEPANGTAAPQKTDSKKNGAKDEPASVIASAPKGKGAEVRAPKTPVEPKSKPKGKSAAKPANKAGDESKPKEPTPAVPAE